MIAGMSVLRRAPRLADVTELAAFLASDRAAGITGTMANATAGLVLKASATFYFDLGSPYAYLAAERIDEVLPGPVRVAAGVAGRPLQAERPLIVVAG